ncbi:MAG: O-acetyl-ADP-ribose deacetylase [Deferrisomatales bacterium]|nr:O-acetyl-ADP-ribose deacetylase [Deferrisomatales bacterium]
MVTEQRFGTSRVTLVQGDITAQVVDAVVNAANSSLLGGGGVDGAIHRVGGPAILAACRTIVARIGRLEPGGAVVTPAGDLPARFVIHTVGPVWRGGVEAEEATLERAYRESLSRALEAGARSVAFPSISTGAYRFPIRRAAAVALATVASVLEDGADLDEVRFVLFSGRDLGVYAETLAALDG